MHVNLVAFRNLTQLDLTGPYEVFSRMRGTTVDIVAATRTAVVSERGLAFVPTKTFKTASRCDLLCVPGGPGINQAMLDDKLLDFLRRQADHAKFVTSVCTGALVLGAAGLLRDYDATTHWSAMEFLPYFGARPAPARVCRDRNRITGGGVTAGIDFALSVAAELCGDELAKAIQLTLEYDPHPPFDCGRPECADQSTIERVNRARAKMHEVRRRAVEQAAKRM